MNYVYILYCLSVIFDTQKSCVNVKDKNWQILKTIVNIAVWPHRQAARNQQNCRRSSIATGGGASIGGWSHALLRRTNIYSPAERLLVSYLQELLSEEDRRRLYLISLTLHLTLRKGENQGVTIFLLTQLYFRNIFFVEHNGYMIDMFACLNIDVLIGMYIRYNVYRYEGLFL